MGYAYTCGDAPEHVELDVLLSVADTHAWCLAIARNPHGLSCLGISIIRWWGVKCSGLLNGDNNNFIEYKREQLKDILIIIFVPQADMQSDGTYHLKILVPSVAAGAIIGKGGETIAQLQKDTNARVKMSKANDFYPGECFLKTIIIAVERYALFLVTLNLVERIVY